MPEDRYSIAVHEHTKPAFAVIEPMHERPVWAEINLDSYHRNVKAIKKGLNASTSLCAIVKADAYGHGMVPIAHEALRAGASCLGVALTDEGVQLRRAGFTEPILIMALTPPELAYAAADYRLEVSVADVCAIEALSMAAKALKTTVKVHLKIDTGMGRIGVRPDDAPGFARQICETDGLNLSGVFSHFADADNGDLSYTRQQLKIFLEACTAIERNGIHIPCKHIANSAAFMNLPESHLDMVRAGILTYGFDSQRQITATNAFTFSPVMTLKAKAAYVKTLDSGDSVSYGRRWTADKPCRIASIPLGYADGYPRNLTNKGFVGIRGQNVPVRGTVCMDQFMIDVSLFDDFRAGEEVIIFGSNGPSADALASLIGTINYEIVCRIGKRVPRVYVRDNS
jgi:alanine racemase